MEVASGPAGWFVPRVAVASSAGAEALAAKNSLACADLLQPFGRISPEGQIKDASGVQYIVKNLRLVFSNINARPPQPTLARKFLNESVSKNYNDKTISKTTGKFQLDVPASTPWFDAWRDTFFQVQFPSDHEFTKHFVACLLMVSSLEPNPMETFSHMCQQLSQMQNVTPPKLPKWFNNNVLRCYVLLHDSTEGNVEKTRKNFEALKQSYGAGNCFLLCINSRNPNEDNCVLPDPWSKYLMRRVEVDSSSEKDSSPRTPADMTVVTNMSVSVGVEAIDKEETSTLIMTDDSGVLCESATEASETGAVLVQVHPLSPSEDNDSIVTFDSSNSLQNDVMTNSMNSEVGIINPNVWDQSSINTGLNNIHGACLSTQDVENIKNFVQDFALKALLPYFERQIYQLQDVVSNKKGVSRSIFNATKRWFGTNKPGSNIPVNSVIYTGDCAELQLRRLGDIWFMLGQWSAAFQVYHTAKREYNSDGAWLCYAGALEMAAISAFMANESSRKTLEYMEESIMKYLTACRMPQFAVRATLLSIQCLCSRGMYSEAARQLIRMTSEDCDLRSAVLLEQAALCFLAEPSKKAFPRKYAFHMVLAGHRYSKAGQRKHSLRCYKQAYQVYRGGGWRLATDHIEFSVGRLAGQIRAWDASAAALSSLLAPHSLQPPAQQAGFLREYLHILQQWITNDSENTYLPQLPIPILESNKTSVLCGGIATATTPGRSVASGTILSSAQFTEKSWINLEKMLLHKAKGSLMIFKPTISVFCNNSDNSTNPISPQNENIQVLVHFQNQLQIDITMLDVQLLWQFKSESSTENCFTNEECIVSSSEYDRAVITTEKVSVVQLQSDKTTSVTLSLIPLHPGELTILGVAYRLCSPSQSNEDTSTNNLSVMGKQIFKIRGPKLKGTKENPGESQYGVDKRLKIIVVPPSPCLQVTFSEMSNHLLCGELQRITVEFRNVGRVPLKSLYMGTSHPQYISLSIESDKDSDPFSSLLETMYTKLPPIQDERQLLLEKEKRARNRHCLKVLDSLGAGQSYSTILWLQAPDQIGNHKLNVLFYYENSQADSPLKHRLLRHSWNITLKDSIQLFAIPRHTLRPCQKESKYVEGLNLAVEIKNANQMHHGILTSLEVQQISLLSQYWQLYNFVPIQQDAKILSSQETLHLVLCACRNTVKNKEKDILFSDINILSNDSGNIVSIKERPYSCFVTNYASVLSDSEIPSELCDNPNNLSDESINSTLVVRWKADITINGGAQRIAVGQHRLILDKMDVKISSLASCDVLKLPEAEPDQNLIMYCLEHELNVKHDFKKQRMCFVPVTLHLVNCSTKMVVAVVNTLNSKSYQGECPGVGWIGIGGNESSGLEVKLSSLQSESVKLKIVCVNPGTYSIGNIIRISCKVLKDEAFSEPILQNHITSSTLIVVIGD